VRSDILLPASHPRRLSRAIRTPIRTIFSCHFAFYQAVGMRNERAGIRRQCLLDTRLERLMIRSGTRSPQMKSTIILAMIAFAPLIGLAQEHPKSQPAALVKLRMNWQQSVSEVTAPLNNKYHEALVKMKTDFTRAGNLDDALAVDAEIKQIEANGALMTLNEVYGTWNITYADGKSYRRDVLKDGTWKEPKDATPGKTWKMDGDRIVFRFPDGGSDWFITPINPKGTKGKTIHGAEFTAVRAHK